MSGIEQVLIFVFTCIFVALYGAKIAIGEYKDLSGGTERKTYEASGLFHSEYLRNQHLRMTINSHEAVNDKAWLVYKVETLYRKAFWFCFTFLVTIYAFG